MNDITARLNLIRKAEPLKDTLRSAYTASGKTESVAEHSWRLTLLALTFADLCPDADTLRLLKLCILHDLGEVIGGDVPVPQQTGDKSSAERADFQSLIADLPDALREDFSNLWDEYEDAQTTEARYAKALDKIETILQHNQGKNPQDFDYGFNLDYGKKYTDATNLTRQIRETLDTETKLNQSRQSNTPAANLACVEIKAFVPSIDFETCKNFYSDMGFTKASDGHGVAYFHHGNCSFMLQQCDNNNPPAPLMMHLLVEDVRHWYSHIQQSGIVAKYGVNITELMDQPWGMREFLLSDPGQVQWRIAQNV
jgi:putative hydrolase of HD superfamily